MRVTFTENALAEYISWQQEDKKTIKRINQLIQDI
jgi:toxin-antitoxin system, toxin component, relE family